MPTMTSKPGTDNQDNRLYSRIPSKAAIEVCRLAFPVTITSEGVGKGRDISDGGIRFTYPEAFDPGQVLALKIGLKGWESHKKPYSMLVDIASEKPFTAIGEVVWCHASETEAGYDVGIKFTGVDDDDWKALSRYLAGAIASGPEH